MLRVMSFGGPSSDGVIAAFQQFVQVQVAKVEVLSCGDTSRTYRQFGGSLGDALAMLSDAQCASVQVASHRQGALVGGIDRPKVGGDGLSYWFAWIDFGDPALDAEASFVEALANDGVTFVALSIEEFPEFDDRRVTAQNFPWSD